MSKKSAYARKREEAFRLGRSRRFRKHGAQTPEEKEIYTSHSMKVDFGLASYRDFYFDILLSSIKGLELTLGEKIALNHMLDKDRFCIETIENRVVSESCKHAVSEKGALYNVSVKIPRQGGVLDARFFVKKYVDLERWEKSLAVEDFLRKSGASSGLVPEVKYRDRRNRIAAYEFIDGEPLCDGFDRLSGDEKESRLKSVIDSLFTLSYDATARIGGQEHFNGISIPPLADAKTSSGRPVLRSMDDNAFHILKFFVIKGNPSLEDRLASWDGEISKKSAEELKNRYPSVQAFMDAYSESASFLDSQPKYFSHGDIHFGNILWTNEGPKFIDWEDAVLAVRQLDLARILQKYGISKESEERILRHAFVVQETAELRAEILNAGDAKEGKYDNNSAKYVKIKKAGRLKAELDEKCEAISRCPESEAKFEEFKKAYRAVQLQRSLMCAAKYLSLSGKSKTPGHRDELREMADFYYTSALNLVRGEDIEGKIKDVVAEVMFGRLHDLGGRINEVACPLESKSFSNVGHRSIVNEVERNEPVKPKVQRGIMIGAAAGAAMAISAFAISSHINDAHSINFLDSICAMQPESSALSLPYVEKYACMYSIKPEMLQAAVSYILISGENIDFGAVSRYSSDPEQLTMSVAKRMHDIMQKRGENYPAILAEMYSGEQAVHSATRLGIAGRYVDFRMLPPVQVAKVASTIAGSGYYAKERTRRVVSGWRR